MWSSHLAGGPVERVHPLGPRNERVRAGAAVRRRPPPRRPPVPRRGGGDPRCRRLGTLARAADRRHPLRDAGARDDGPRPGYDAQRRHGPLRRGPLRHREARAAAADRPRLDRGPAVAHPPPRHQRPDVRRSTDATIRVESTRAAVPQPGDDRERRSTSAPCGATCCDAAPDGELRLARRHITVEESVLRTQNLAIFL